MGFLNPALLPLSGLAAIPLIIHILSRLRLQRRPFPSLLLLHTVKRERFSWLKLKEVVLLILRTLALAALLLALTRPYCRARIPGLDRAGDLVLILDDSYSMGYGSRWQLATDRSRELLRSTGTGKRLAFLTATGRYVPAQTGSHRTALNLLDSLEPCGPAPTLSSAIAQGVALAESLRASVVVITDLQERTIPPDLKLPVGVEVTLEDVGAPGGGNAAITRLYPAGGIALPGRPNQLRAELVNYSERKTTRTLTLETDGKRETRILELTPGARLTHTFEMQLSQHGTYVCRAEISPDSLPVDDTRLLVLTLAERTPVLVVESDRVPGRYVLSALSADSAAGFAPVVTNASALGRENLARYRAVVCTDPFALRPADWNRLRYYLQTGGACLLMAGAAPSGAADLGGYAQAGGENRTAGFVSLKAVDTTHQSFYRLNAQTFSSVHVWKRALLKATKARTLARFSDDEPAVMEIPDGRVVIWAIAPVPDHSDLVYRAGFVPLLHQTVNYLTQSSRQTEYAAGDTIRLRVGQALAATAVTPRLHLNLTPVLEQNQAVFVLTDTRIPGLYSIKLGASASEPKEAIFAVNPLAEEGNPTRASLQRLTNQGFRVQNAGSARSSDLSHPLLLLAALSFCSEMLLLVVDGFRRRHGFHHPEAKTTVDRIGN